MPDQEIALMAHLLRRAGFGASRDEIEAKAAQGYAAVVEELLNPATQPGVEEDLLYRYQPAYNEAAAIETNVQQWVYYMINNPRQLEEKMALFWHMIFCAGHSKIDSGQEMGLMVRMFREHGKQRIAMIKIRPRVSHCPKTRSSLCFGSAGKDLRMPRRCVFRQV